MGREERESFKKGIGTEDGDGREVIRRGWTEGKRSSQEERKGEVYHPADWPWLKAFC